MGAEPSVAPETPASEDHGDALETLRENVVETIGWPLDRWAVAATLESMGLRDTDAETKFGYDSIFHLAAEIHGRIVNDPPPAPEADTDDTLSWYRRLGSFLYFYCKGTLFAFPMAGQIAAVLVLRYSLWAWLDFTNLSATLVALGTISSFMASGGLIQALGREGTFYSGQKNWKLLREVCQLIVGIGIGLSFAVTLVAALFNVVTPFLPWNQFGIVALYFGLLTPMWLFLGVLFMLQDNVAIVTATLLGTGAVHLVMTFTEGGIYVAHWTGLFCTNVLAGAWAWFRIHRKQKSLEGRFEKSKLPRASVLLYIVLPFLSYGVLYFSFLFVDRLVGWSAADGQLPLLIWFRTAYELGMDWALLSLVFTIAVLEYTINEFSRTIIPVQQRIQAEQYVQHNEHFARFYYRQRRLLVVVAVVSVLLTYFGVLQIQRYDNIKEVRDFFESPITYVVFWNASLGYSLLAIGLLNSLFFFSLAKPVVVLRCIGPAFVINVAVGYFASRLLSYEYSVLGLVCGAAYFAYSSSRQARRLFRELDFFYYSAF